jgi:hypothetical protein
MRLVPEISCRGDFRCQEVIAVFAIDIAAELRENLGGEKAFWLRRRSTYECQSVVQVRVVELKRDVVDPWLNPICPPFSCEREYQSRTQGSEMDTYA